MRWYLTPQRLAKFQPHSSFKCWRDCDHVGTLLHILWNCPLLQHLWRGVEDMIHKVLHIPVLLTPQLSILNLSMDSIPTKLRLVTIHILLATKLWKTKEVPHIAEVISLVQTHYTYEIMLS